MELGANRPFQKTHVRVHRRATPRIVFESAVFLRPQDNNAELRGFKILDSKWQWTHSVRKVLFLHRGELFIFVDTVFTNGHEIKTLPDVIDFVYAFIAFCVSYFKCISEMKY